VVVHQTAAVLHLQGGPFKYSTPRALEESEIPGVVEAFVTAAKNAREAGFDGVEVRGYPVCCAPFLRHLLACPTLVVHMCTLQWVYRPTTK
jgi:hypothetical protein